MKKQVYTRLDGTEITRWSPDSRGELVQLLERLGPEPDSHPYAGLESVQTSISTRDGQQKEEDVRHESVSR